MNSKGQGSGVFQLLISAVVALAILGVLLSIIGALPQLSSDPESTARNTLKEAYTSQGSVRFSSKVTLTKDRTISRAGVTPQELGLDRQKVCISWKDNFNSIFGGSDPAEGTIARYSGTGSRDVKTAVLCDQGAALASDAADVFGSDLPVPGVCGSPPSGTENEIYCLVAILPP